MANEAGSTEGHADLGWRGLDRNAPEIVQQREYLQASSGLREVEILDPSEIGRAVKIFRRDGFVLVRNALDADQTAFLRQGVVEVVDDIVALDEQRGGNRGSHRDGGGDANGMIFSFDCGDAEHAPQLGYSATFRGS